MSATDGGAARALTDLDDGEVLVAIRRRYATDAFKTAGMMPVMNGRMKAQLSPYVERGLLSWREHELPVQSHAGALYFGLGWVSLTGAADAMLAARAQQPAQTEGE